jgi:upstream activation factor subunit UAF30
VAPERSGPQNPAFLLDFARFRPANCIGGRVVSLNPGECAMASAKQSGSKKTPSKSAGSSKGGSKAGGESKARGGIAKPVQPDQQLAAVVGNDAMPRTELTKRVWDYIKKNNLQDSENRRMINADDKLKPIFGGKDQVSMFEMTKLVNQHVK